jgi:hypothetical protein
MDQKPKPIDDDCIVNWIYTKEEWGHFETWDAKRKGILNYLWQLFFKKAFNSSIRFTKTYVQVGEKRKYFIGPVTELRRVDIYDKGLINILNITYENIAKNQLNEINIPIPKGKLKEAIDAREILHELISG